MSQRASGILLHLTSQRHQSETRRMQVRFPQRPAGLRLASFAWKKNA